MSKRITVRIVDPSLRKPSPADARVYFVGIEDGTRLPPKATIHFGLANMGIAPAGIEKPNTGHHHLLIDTKLPALDDPIPNDFHHLHFGAGQTEATVELLPGWHTLQLCSVMKIMYPTTRRHVEAGQGAGHQARS